MKIGYARVSTTDQDLALQNSALTQAGCERIYKEKLSAKVERPGLKELLANIRPGDVIVVWKLDRLARSTKELLSISELLKEKGVGLESIQEKIDTTTPLGRLYYTLLSAFAEFEHAIIRERVIAGIAQARADGVRVGRQVGLTKEGKAKAKAVCTLYTTTVFGIQDIARQLGIARVTVYRYLKLNNIPLRQEKYVINEPSKLIQDEQ